MKFNFGGFSDVDAQRLQRFARDIERAFEAVPEATRRVYSAALNFAAPASVPGFTSQTVTIQGAEMGDTVLVAASIAPPAGFMPPVAFVSAANTITVRWLQVTGAAADPDGLGATYTIDLFRH